MAKTKEKDIYEHGILCMKNLYPEGYEKMLNELNNQGKYTEVYRKCELILIEWADGKEWFCDNYWYKTEEETGVQELTGTDELLDSISNKSKEDKPLRPWEKRDKKKPSLELMDIFSVASYWTNNFARSFYISYKLLNSRYTDNPKIFDRFMRNIIYSIKKDKVKNKMLFYPVDVVMMLNNKDRKKYGLVTLTMTTCKRMKLFRKTMDSFLNSCKDIYLIDRFLIIDDNSSETDRERMRELYPFIELVCKDPKDKGHPISMNMIRNMVETPYTLHLEDDHQFFCHRNYIRPALRIMKEKSNIKQVLFNQHYCEIPDDLPRIKGGALLKTSNGKKYYVHIHRQMGTHEYNEHQKKLNGPSNLHWPHFSFRPSLIDSSVFKEVGEFKMEQEFERSYGYRYTQLGYMSAFLLGIHHIHIGRTSHDLRSGKNVENAYTLNDTRQWGY